MNRLYVLVTMTILAGFFYLFFVRNNSDNHRAITITHEFEETDGMDKAIQQEFERTKDPATGTVPTERLLIAQQNQQARFAQQMAGREQSAVPGISWTERGPDNVGGRTRGMLYDLNDITGKKVWAAGVGGGLWYTNDITAADPVWNKVDDHFDNLAVTSIVQEPFHRNIMYFSTGEGVFNGDAIRGFGIWRSLDGGATWTRLTSTESPAFRFVNKILYAPFGGGGPCPVDKPALLAATRDSGIQRSVDSGQTWQKCLGNGVGGGTVNASADLEAQYYYTYATLGIVGKGGGGIFRSCNAGKDWEKIYNASGDEQRIEIAAGGILGLGWRSMYALIQGSNKKIKTIMRADNIDTVPANKVNWITKTLPMWCDQGSNSNDFTRQQAWYDLIASVDPNDFQTVYIGGVDMHKSIDSGTTWTQISEWTKPAVCGYSYVHADIHEILFKPCINGTCVSNELLVATDGGIFRSVNAGNTFTERNKSYNITQYYGCAIHPTSTNYFLAGAQDNGSQIFSTPGINSTSNASGGDGGFCHIDQNNPDTQITSYVNNNYFVSTDAGNNFNQRFKNNRGQFINPTDYDNTAKILYCGDDAGNYFRWRNPGSDGPALAVSVTAFNGAKVTHVVVSPHIANRVYFGLDNGAVVMVDDANSGNSKVGVIIKPDIGAVSVSCVAIDPSDENHMLVSYSNYGITSVYESTAGTGGGLDWHSVDNPSLPDMPIRWCMFDPRSSNWAILATELGIWSTNHLDGAATDWQPTNNNFANTRVDMLKYRAFDRTLLAATHGRGLFTTNIPAGAALPIFLLDFRGRLLGNDVQLDWETSYERNSKGFEIQKSTDGSHFSKIGFVSAIGNSSINRFYTFHDKDITQETNYYRLNLVDLDGKSEYSKIILLKNPLIVKSIFKVLNNPFKNTLDLQFGNISGNNYEVRLIDMAGKSVMQWTVKVNPNSRMRFDLTKKNLSNGLYTIQLLADNHKYSLRVMRE